MVPAAWDLAFASYYMWVCAVGKPSLVKVQHSNHESTQWAISLWMWQKSHGMRELDELNSWHMTNDTGKYQVSRNKNTLRASHKRVKNDGTGVGALMVKTGGRGHPSPHHMHMFQGTKLTHYLSLV